jgi:hypothetical protein
MSKSNFFTGQPVFSIILNLIDQKDVNLLAKKLGSDKYYKYFNTYNHLVTMLYATLNQCTSLREITLGLLSWESRILHLGITRFPRRSTLADANKNRSAECFEKIFFLLRDRFNKFLPDSREENVYIMDSTTITLFSDLLKAAGRPPLTGAQKGGLKVHLLLHALADLPEIVYYSASAAQDVTYIKKITLPKGSVIVFDKGYNDYSTYNRFTEEGVTWVTRKNASAIYTVKEERDVSTDQKDTGILSDKIITLGHNHHNKNTVVEGRIIAYLDPEKNEVYEFITNNVELDAKSIADYYKKRWQIENFFKRIKQNFPLKYFLGDNVNAIKIQIWCTLIADLLLKVIKAKGKSKIAYSNLVTMVRLLLMSYVDLIKFLQTPEKVLLKIANQRIPNNRIIQPSLFPT